MLSASIDDFSKINCNSTFSLLVLEFISVLSFYNADEFELRANSPVLFFDALHRI